MKAMPTDREKLVRDMDLALAKGGLAAVLTVVEEAFIRLLEQFGASGGEGVTSKGLCQGEGGSEALVAVLVHEHGEQDAIHGGLVLEGAHRAGAAADCAEASLDRVGGADRLARGETVVAEAGQEIVEVGAQAGDRFG